MSWPQYALARFVITYFACLTSSLGQITRTSLQSSPLTCPGKNPATRSLIFYGAVNPSGKLPYTIAFNESDYSFVDIANSSALQETEDPNAWQSNFTEGLLIDYRHFDYYNESVQYEFGHGLSYTTFDMSNLDIESVYVNATVSATPDSVPAVPGVSPELWATLYTVNVTVKNTGSLAGATVPQLYLSLPQVQNSIPTPINVLRGFEKGYLQPGESQHVQFPCAVPLDETGLESLGRGATGMGYCSGKHRCQCRIQFERYPFGR